MHELIRIATRELAAFLSTHLPALGSQWWTTRVEEQLNFSQQQRVRERGLTKLDQLDFAPLLRIVDRNWYDLSRTANLPREGRNWVKELQTVRNNWAHESAEPAAPDDVYRDADTLGRCLKMLGATPQCLAAVEAVKSAALEDMAAARRGGAASSEPPPIPPRLGPKHPVPKPTETAGRVEVRDHVLWTKHIRGDDTLKVTLNALSERSQIDLEVDGYRGTWQKMDDGRNGQPTAGLKPLEPARSHWHTLVRNTMGRVVTICACIRRAERRDGARRTKLRGGLGTDPKECRPGRHDQELEPSQRIQGQRPHDSCGRSPLRRYRQSWRRKHSAHSQRGFLPRPRTLERLHLGRVRAQPVEGYHPILDVRDQHSPSCLGERPKVAAGRSHPGTLEEYVPIQARNQPLALRWLWEMTVTAA